jgi:hypothetical protein
MEGGVRVVAGVETTQTEVRLKKMEVTMRLLEGTVCRVAVG